MPKTYYPAVLERSGGGTIAIWFPDFPDCVAAGNSQDAAMEKAERALKITIVEHAERARPLPVPSNIAAITLPRNCDVIAVALIGAEIPDPSERVNVYLPKSLLAEADKRATELGMSRSSFFGLAVSILMGRQVSIPVGRSTHSAKG
ncbi:MAG: type II toxin-antitoxin system HicB family antitoxin [Alphaproteobacteria bacterium]|nr:type II toxin-antitoxin system HicB family antitoxin [Alphaproteobacteria bacterium]